MLYKVRGMLQRADGELVEVSRMQQASSDEQAIAKFLESWEEYGDTVPLSPRITQRWSQQL